MKTTVSHRVVSGFLAILFVFAFAMPTAFAAAPTLTVGTAQGKQGRSVSVPITVANNSGIVALRIFVQYDKNTMQLTDVQNGDIFPADKSTFTNNLQSVPYVMLWMDGTATTDYTANGTLATLTFTIADTAKAGTYPITLTYDSRSTFDRNLNEAAFSLQNGSVTVVDEEALYTATFIADGEVVSTAQYHAGDPIVKPDDPVKSGYYVFKGWNPAVPALMPAEDVTFTAEFEKVTGVSIAIRNYVETRTVDYRTTVTFTADVPERVDGAEVHWYINGSYILQTGDRYTKHEATSSYTVQAKYVKDGKIWAESEIETVNVKTGFFAKLKAFFRSIFGRLPKIEQEYPGMEIIDRVLP